MRLILPASLGALLVLAAASAPADEDRPDHYQGLASPTLEAALQNLAEYNRRLAALLEAPRLEPGDLATVHNLTYTLENALQRIDTELDAMAETLEAVHLASEAQDEATVRAQGRAYLSSSGRLVD